MNVWIAYDPLVFREALIRLLSQLDYVEVVDNPSVGVDVGIFRLADTGQLQDFFQHKSLPDAKLIVFSAKGNQAFIRLPGEKNWKSVKPFGMPQLITEIEASRERCKRATKNEVIYL
jgi:hypothetical protein